MLEQQTAVIAAVPQIEELVGPLRTQLDPAASWGVPAHVTVLYPFVPVVDLPGAIGRLADLARSLSPIKVEFARLEWFEHRVLYLAPEPEAWFRAITAQVVAAFPQCPPYGGIFDDVIPHLTVADGADPHEMTVAAEALARSLPLSGHVEELLVLTGIPEPDGWQIVERLPLGDQSIS